MEINLNERNLGHNNIDDKKAKEMEEFINDLEKFVNEKNPLRKEKNENICVVKDRKEEKLTLVDISNGKEFDIFIARNKEDIMQLKQANINKNIYEVSQKDFYNIDLGYNVVLNGNNCIAYDKDIEIKNEEALTKLEDLYFNLKEEEGQVFKVDKITNEKVYLTSEDGGYFSLYRQAYPNIKEGEKLKKENRRYVQFK